MNSFILKSMTIIITVAALAGCKSVAIRKPIGDKVKDLTAEVDQWNGTWVGGDKEEALLMLRVKDAAQGQLDLMMIDDKDSTLSVRNMTCYVKESGNWSFISVKDPDHENEELYYWAKIERQGRHITCWSPDPDKFSAAVRDAKLPGTGENNVILEKLSPEQVAGIREGKYGPLLNWEQPIVFWKVSEYCPGEHTDKSAPKTDQTQSAQH